MSTTEKPSMRRKLLFVGGFPSSGTDLVKSILNVHPLVHINGEMPLLRKLPEHGYSATTQLESLEQIDDLRSVLGRLNTWGNIENLEQDFSCLLEQESTLPLNDALRVFFSPEDKAVWGNKTPQNTEHIEELARLFPNAYFLTIVRDVRDVCLSWQKKWGKDVLVCSRKWAARMQLGLMQASRLPSSQSHLVRYEDFLTDTRGACRDICDFLDIPFTERMLNHQDFTTDKRDGKINYGRRVLSENQQKWQAGLSVPTVRRIEEISYSTLPLFGYKPMYATEARPITTIENTVGLITDIRAMMFVGNRSIEQNSVHRRVLDLAWELRKRL